MAAKWSPEMEGYFITEVFKKKYLWDIRDPHYHRKNLKHLGYEEISNLMLSKWPSHASLFDTELLKRKFLNLKSYYYKKKKLLSTFQSGPGALDVQPKWGNFYKLAFLNGAFETQESSSNLDIAVKCEMTLSEAESEPDEASEINCMVEETPRLSTPNRKSECDKSSDKEKRSKSPEDMHNQSTNLLQKSSTEKKDLDGEDGYGLYIAEYMRSMPRKKREKARLKIQQILYEIKYNESSDEE